MDASDLTSDRPRTIKTEGKQIVLFRVAGQADDADASTAENGAGSAAGEVWAIDNRCPHEGYPLSTGMLKDGVLTCEWHNWKFRLCDGKCILGGEDVRHYPLQIRDDGGIWLDLAEPVAEERFPALYQSLETAFFENAWGHAGRTVERLLVGGEDPLKILAFGCDWAARHTPYGFDHGMAVAADMAEILASEPDQSPGELVLQALSLMVEPNLRRPERALGGAQPKDRELVAGNDWNAVEDELRRRIEAEDLVGSEGLTRAALDAGAGSKEVFAWLTHAATDHFLGYGHSHIYCVKAEELLDAIGWSHAHPVLTSLVSSIVYDTREDRLPYMRDFRRLVEPYMGRLAEWAAIEPSSAVKLDADELIAAVVDGDLSAALAGVAERLDRGVAPDRIALALAIASAQRMMRFDQAIEENQDLSENWLSITHSLTHADAVRESLMRRPSADGLRGLFHSARFVQHLAACDAPAEKRPRVPEQAPDPEAADRGLIRALKSGDALGAMAAVRHGPATSEALASALRRFVASDRAAIPIFIDHHIKVAMAALRLVRATLADPELGQHPDRDLPLVATARFLACPLQERRVVRRARIARTFVREGRMQEKLLGY